MSIAQLGYEIDSSQAVEAERNLDRMGEAAGRASNDAQGLEKQSSGLAATFRRMAPLVAGLAASLAGMFSARAVIGAAEQYENRMARVNAVIQATGGVAGRTAEQLEANAQALARATLESVDGVMQAQQTLLTFRNVQGEVFDRAIESAADLSAAMGQDLTSSTRQLARALEDPIQGVTALTRSGTVFTQQQRDMIRTLVESGDLLGAQNLILEELEGQYGGVARAGAGLREAKDSLSQSVTNLLVEFNENLGLTDSLARQYNRLSETVQWLADNMDEVLERAIDSVVNAFKILISLTVAYYATHIPALLAAIVAKTSALTLANAQLVIMNAQLVAGAIAARTMTVAARGLGAAMAFVGGPLGLVLGILGGLTAAAILFRDTTETMTPIIDDAKDAIDRINSVLAVSSESALPAAQRETLALTNENIKLAKSAYAAARAELAKAQAAGEAARQQLAVEQAFLPIEQEQLPGFAALEKQTEITKRALKELADAEAGLTDRINEGQLALSGASEAMAENQRRAIELSVTMDDLASSIGGSGGGGGGSGGEDTGLLSRFEALQDELRTQAEQVELWYMQAQETLQWALENERITLEEHAQMKLEIERLYQEQLAAIRGQANAQQLGEMSYFFDGMAQLAQAGGDRMARIARVFGAIQATINSYVAATAAMAETPGSMWVRLGAYAKVLATGLGAVAAIRGGGSSGGGGSSPSRAEGVTQQQAPLRRTIVELRGPDWVKGIIQPVMEQIYEASEDGQVVFAR